MLTIYRAKKEKIKLENRSVMIEFRKEIFAQMIVVKNPVTRPAIAPYLFILFHHKDIINTGPKEDPNPLQA